VANIYSNTLHLLVDLIWQSGRPQMGSPQWHSCVSLLRVRAPGVPALPPCNRAKEGREGVHRPGGLPSANIKCLNSSMAVNRRQKLSFKCNLNAKGVALMMRVELSGSQHLWNGQAAQCSLPSLGWSRISAAPHSSVHLQTPRFGWASQTYVVIAAKMCKLLN